MVQITEGNLTFGFPEGAIVAKYDTCSFYRNQFNSAFGGTKAIDLIYVENNQTWLIEVKDYRRHNRTKTIDIGDELALKVRDTLAGLAAASFNANDQNEKRIAKQALRTRSIKIVLHIEQPSKHSKLFRQAIDPSKLEMKLKQALRAVDAHPIVVDMNSLTNKMNWKVT